ncbi:MAG: SDR family oxidoreductase [Candidatus Eisenbacteria bacterium]|uniref:SDR family oxidoreductase n=1 Tax=Eiseniibacteriota bacterium TaxID=2212470 RepID=A0A7Y2E8G6_UNCEI|nr:SDR family oxidoreductase [Candidatus Eisenbacteria bacterium]
MTNSQRLKGQVAIVTGASRGIGRNVALGLAREGANVVIAAKSTTQREKLPGTIFSVAKEVEAIGPRALPVKTDLREETEINDLVDQTIDTFGRVDILVNNAGALWWQPMENTPLKRFDLVMDVNVRGSFALTQACLPHMKTQKHGHILVFSPPVHLPALAGKVAYLISKFGMTMMAHGLAEELKGSGVAINALWPITAIESQATINYKIGNPKTWRKPEIVTDATLEVVTTPPEELSGRALLDEEFLRERGWTDFVKYRCDPDHEPPHMFAKDIPMRGNVTDVG